MDKRIVIQGNKENVQVCLLEEGQLMEYYLEERASQPLVGSIYKGKVENVLPGMQAAFVNIGLQKNAFLYVQEAIQHYEEDQLEKKVLPPIESIVKEGQELLVQIIKEPGGQKGARISTHPTLAGRALVYMPTLEHTGISRKIEDEGERARLTSLVRELCQPGEGVIVRTVAQGKPKEVLATELKALKEKWQLIMDQYKAAQATSAIYYDLSLGKRLVRDFIRDDVSAIFINDEELFHQIQQHLSIDNPNQLPRLELIQGDILLKYQIYDQLSIALQRKVLLKSGGYLVFDQTEALLVIDVNTGKYIGNKSLEDTVFQLNMEALKEACRQIRLRNVGGIIVIDFIDMKDEAHKEKIMETLLEEVKKDHMRVTVLGMTALGLVELTRKKVRPSLSNTLQITCPTCGGLGYVNRSQFLDME